MVTDAQSFNPGLITSRRALIDVITGLADHSEALTVLGGHAVVEITHGIPDLPPPDATNDGDLGVLPELLGDDPNLSERMVMLGYETARQERPGVWSPVNQRQLDIHLRDSVDLIAPYELSYPEGARPPRRAARAGDHGSHAVSATHGTELSIIDRRLMMLRAFDGGVGVEAYIAEPSALLCAKAYKIADRLNPKERARNGGRLRSKDYADMYRLMLAVVPEEASDIFAEGERTARISAAVALGREHLLSILADESDAAARVADTWGDPSLESHIRRTIIAWRDRFSSAG